MSIEKIKATDVLIESFSILWREKELALLLTSLYSVVVIILLWPFLDLYLLALESLLNPGSVDQGALNQVAPQASDFQYYFILMLPILLLQYSGLALWSRVSILGKSSALDGGIKAFLVRGLWAVWRLICSFGWMLLLTLALVAVIFLAGVIFGLGLGVSGVSGNADGSVSLIVLLILPLYILYFFAVMALTFLAMFAIHGESRDHHIPINLSFKYMKGNLLRATGGLLLMMIGFYVLYIIGIFAVIGLLMAGPGWLTVLGFIVVTIIAMIFNFAWVSFSALYASKLVPELKV